jgi:formamidopyrimidine-DNA glycosylase
VPELPDVEAFRRFFDSHARGRTVRRVVVPDPTIVRNATPRQLGRALKGRRFEEAGRHGKWMIAWTDGPALLLHFGMTGDLIWSADEPSRHRHDRVILELEGGDELRYRNMRKLGGAWLAHDPEEAVAVMGSLGPDALDVRRRQFHELVGRRRGGLKALLMDQRFVAGIGNLLADEIAWQSRLHPRTPVESLDASAVDALYDTMRKVLTRWVAGYGGMPARRRGTDWLIHDRAVGGRCPRCGTELSRAVVAGRTTFWCPSCQPAPPGLVPKEE